jgi:hypothetical protein
VKDYSVAWDRNEIPAGASPPIGISNLDKGGSDFSPAWNEIASLAYFKYVNRGSAPGKDVADWLEAEAQLLAQHNSWGSRGLCSEI